MECEIVFSAARSGNLNTLKYILDKKPEDEVQVLVSTPTNGATPLIIACRNGHVAVIIYLLEKCKADIEQVGSIEYFDPEYGNCAPPLWWAAAVGHLHVVKTLVKYKASLNSITKYDNYTPVFIACFNSNFFIARHLIENGADVDIPDQSGDTCLILTCSLGYYELSKYLVERGADVNKKNAHGHTSLHACVRAGELDILGLLLKHGARMEMDEYGQTPLVYAANKGDVSTVEYFIREYKGPKKDLVNALELLGSTFVDKFWDKMSAYIFWKRAMELRYESTEFPLEKPEDKVPFSSYVDATEVLTLSELSGLSDDEIKIQALLIKERILGPVHSLHDIRNRGNQYAADGNFKRCVQLWVYILDTVLKYLPSREHSYYIKLTSLDCEIRARLLILFHRIIYEAMDARSVSFHDILHVFESVLQTVETLRSRNQNKDSDSTYYHSDLSYAMCLLNYMCKLQPYLKPNEDMSLKKAAYKLVNMNLKGARGFTPLHYASIENISWPDLVSDVYQITTSSFQIFPSVEVVDLLLEVGACPNSRDKYNNTPLHYVTLNRSCDSVVFNTLLSQGAHLDLVNIKNINPLQLIHKDTSVICIYPLQYTKLQCLCAQTINKYKIPYTGLVHKKLCEFVDLHCAR